MRDAAPRLKGHAPRAKSVENDGIYRLLRRVIAIIMSAEVHDRVIS